MLRERKAVPAHGVHERAPHLPVDAGHVDAFDHHVAAVPVTAHAVERHCHGDSDELHMHADRSCRYIYTYQTTQLMDHQSRHVLQCMYYYYLVMGGSEGVEASHDEAAAVHVFHEALFGCSRIHINPHVLGWI